jgi:CBS domain-containing protein
MTSQHRGIELIEIYNQLIEWFKTKINQTDHKNSPYPAGIDYVYRNKLLHPNKIARLQDYRTLRNAIVHSTTPAGSGGGFIAEPSEAAVTEYRALVHELLNPPKLMDIAIKFSQVYSTTLQARAIDVMREMNQHAYTHVPVLTDGRVVGVFSENTVMSFIVRADDVVHKDTRIAEFADFLPIEKHISETFLFVSQDTPVVDVCNMFADAKEKGVRVGAVFITHSGKSDQGLLGLVTAWDLAGVDAM